MIGTLRSGKVWVVLGMGALCVATASPAYAQEAKGDIEAELDRRIALWNEEFRTKYSFSSMPEGIPSFQGIVDLGIPAVPFLMERIEEGPSNLIVAVWQITQKRFTEDALPEGYWGNPEVRRRMWVEWWKNARKSTPQRFERLYSERMKFWKKGKYEEAKERLHQIDCLGVAALPLVLEKAAQTGDSGLLYVAQAITKGQIKGMSCSERAVWWDKHRQEWLIPFPNTRPIAKAGTDRTATAGQVIVLDGSASMDADGDVLTYQWRQTAGPVAELSNAQTVQPTFTGPAVEQRTALVFELIVDDAGDLTQTVPTPNSKSEPATVTITIEPK